MDLASVLPGCIERIETDLRRNVLPFWIERVVDRGTFLGGLSNDLVPDRTLERG